MLLIGGLSWVMIDVYGLTFKFLGGGGAGGGAGDDDDDDDDDDGAATFMALLVWEKLGKRWGW